MVNFLFCRYYAKFKILSKLTYAYKLVVHLVSKSGESACKHFCVKLEIDQIDLRFYDVYSD